MWKPWQEPALAGIEEDAIGIIDVARGEIVASVKVGERPGAIAIGDGFAWMEGILVIATLARSWRMRLVPGHPVELRPVVTLRPKHGMRMTLGLRNGG